MHLVYACACVYCRPVFARAIAHARGKVGAGECACQWWLVRSYLEGPRAPALATGGRGAGAGAGPAIPGPRAPAENEIGPTWVLAMHTRNRLAAGGGGRWGAGRAIPRTSQHSA